MLHESLTDVLIECVKACGGSKAVGVALWPAKGIEAAQRQLLACLNSDRNEKLSPEEVLHIAKLAREKGCHAYAEWVAHDLGYSKPNPIDPEDELAELLRQNNELRARQIASSDRIEKLLQRSHIRSVA